MAKKKKRKVKSGALLYLILFVLAVTIGVLSVNKFLNGVSNSKRIEYSKELDYFGKKLNVKLYVNGEKNGDEIFAEVDKILSHYNQISNRSQSFDGINNIYSINSSNSLQKLSIDADLYNIIKYSVNWFYGNGQILNINMGNLYNVWKPYLDSKNGTPSVDEVNKVVGIDMKDVVLYSDNQILAGKVNLDVDDIALAFALDELKQYFKKVSFDYYYIKADNIYLIGKNIDKDTFDFTIDKADGEGVLQENSKDIKLNLSNKFVSTSGIYNSYKANDYNIHKTLDFRTRIPANYVKSVTVVCDDPILGQSLASTLFLISIEDGQEYMKNFNNVDVVWYTNDDQIITTAGIKKLR